VYNALAALAAADHYQIDIATLGAVFSTCNDLSGRFKTIMGQILIIDDSYNANPYSFSQALIRFSALKTKRRKIVVCGDMLELGSYSEHYHIELAKQIVASGADLVVGVGKDIAYTIDTIKNIRPDLDCFYYPHNEDALLLLRQEINTGDIVLVKGSRGIKLDLIVDALSRVYCPNDVLVS
jgi:UDP-N-acetylmuramoyl-tripeptide--D-alanyl-D-alanine ligase